MTPPISTDPLDIGRSMHALATELYPICRSITGPGLRQTLDLISRRIPLERYQVASGTRAFDWTVPPEWTMRDAWIKDPAGKKIVSFADSNLHVVNYSMPFRGRLPLSELRPHLHSLPQHPDWIPYKYSHWEPTWGFCLTHRQLESLAEGTYEVCIDATLEPGQLDWGECFLPGKSSDEVLISSHCCHPSLCNDNLSGIALAVHLALALQKQERRYSYRFLFMPGTIGAIVWLSRNQAAAERIRHGLVLTCVGDAGPITYKKSRRGDADIDRAMMQMLRDSGRKGTVQEFSPQGYDERQFCSPGFNLPVGCLMRTPHGCFEQYHTSADNLDLIQPASLGDSFAAAMATIWMLEHNGIYRNLEPHCEPQLGRHGIFTAIRAHPQPQDFQLAILWVLNLGDGENDLLAIARRSGLPFELIAQAADLLASAALVARVADGRQ
jgi:aminopeptidase-like protein